MPRHDEGFFTAKDNLRLFWESDTPDGDVRAVVGLAHGFADHIGRYRTTRDALVAKGFALHGFDFRGHGQSDGKRGHVESFDDYVDDLERFHGRLRDAAQGKPVFFLAHSNGALVTLLYLARQPPGVSGAVLSSPFLGLAFKPPLVKLAAARVLNRLVPSILMGNELKVADLSRDPEWQAATARDPLYHHTISPRWFMEAMQAQVRALAQAPRLKCPMLVLCGSEDRIAAVAVSRTFFETLGSADKQYKEYPGMRHEILNELGKEEVFADVVRWISSHL